MQISEVSFKVCRIDLPVSPSIPGAASRLKHEERPPSKIDAEGWKSAVNFSFLLC